MTTEEWLLCEEAIPMLDFLGDNASERKLRLFACLCCRQSWLRLTDHRSRQAVEVAESYADGRVSRKELEAAYSAAETARKESRSDAHQQAAWVATLTAIPSYTPFGINDLGLLADWAAGRSTQQRSRQQCQWLRDLFGDRFRALTINPLLAVLERRQYPQARPSNPRRTPVSRPTGSRRRPRRSRLHGASYPRSPSRAWSSCSRLPPAIR
jgi:hypothetical protein